ncbi:MAG: histidine kinase [Alistipes sp.]|nr:histidine kinase [Alistipes sp.]
MHKYPPIVKSLHIGNIAIVLIFALLHFAVAIVSRMLHNYDDIPLTLLTITMIIVVAMRNETRAEMVAALTLGATLSGFLIGSWLWEPIEMLVGNSNLAPAIATFIITTILGVVTDYITSTSKRFRSSNPTWRLTAGNIVIIALSILVLRMLYVVMFRSGLFTEGQLLHSILDLMTNTWAILIILAGNIILTVRSQQYTRKMNLRRKGIITLLISVTFLSITAATLIYFDVPYFSTPSSGIGDFLRILAAAIMVDLMVAMSCLLFHLSISSKQALKVERAEKHRTEYQYERLKQQINPHFLFNSLGILDYLVQEHETERASVFIRKLANMYRYMLNNDNKELVKLSEEIDFTMMYVDLLKERFVEGMVIDIDIDKTMNNRYVVPCSIQLLVENATKHNIVAVESPLHISIKTEGELLVVRNNLQQRTHGQPSTHLGLANISRQYLDITRRDIEILKSETEFIVKLPIV